MGGKDDMNDFNGNGRVDPTDIAISMAMEEETESKKESREKRAETTVPAGCLTGILFCFFVVAAVAVLI